MTDVDTALMDRACQGDMNAFAEVFEPLRGVLHAVACRLVGPDDADDVVMETFLRAWQALPRFNRRSALKTWLYRIARNGAVDVLRRKQRRNELFLGSTEADEPVEYDLPDTTHPGPDQLVAQAEDAAWVLAALARLPALHRVALELRYADGLAYGEIAAATGVSIGTVMSRLFNGKRKLRKLLEEKEKR